MPHDVISAMDVRVKSLYRCVRKNYIAVDKVSHLSKLEFTTSDGRSLTCADAGNNWWGTQNKDRVYDAPSVTFVENMTQGSDGIVTGITTEAITWV